MSVDPETLMAYADGELDAVNAKRVEKAIAADPALAAEIERHRALRMRLKAHFDPVAEAPVPDALTDMLRDSAKVVDLAAAREARKPVGRRWWGGAVAASLVLGVAIGQLWQPGGDFAAHDGRLVASGKVARALDSQLAATQPGDAPVRMLVSFRSADGAYCRVFQGAAQGGIACRESDAWQVRQLRAVPHGQASDYRQAGSDAGPLLADAQAMMAGAPLDAEQESAAARNGWRR